MQQLISGIRRTASVLCRFEVVPLAMAVPFLMFPNQWTGFAVGLIILPWILRWIATGRLSIRTPLDAPIIILLVMTFIGMYISVEPSASWPKFWGIILGIGLYYGMANGLRSERQVLGAALGLLVVGIGVAAFSLVSTDWKGGQIFDLSIIYDRIPSLIRDLPSGGVPRRAPLLWPREVGGTMGLLLPLAFALLIGGRGWVVRTLAIIAALVLATVLVLSQALSAIAGALIAVFLLLVWRNRWFLLLVPAVLVLFVTLDHFYGLSGLLRNVLSVDNRLGASIWGRPLLWLWGLTMLGDLPFTGVGLNAFDTVLVNLYPMSLYWSVIHAHQVFLQTALDVGIPGLVAFLWILGALGYMTFRGLQRIENRISQAILVGVAGGVLSYMVFGLMDTFTLGAKPGAAFWGMLGLTAALVKPYNTAIIRSRDTIWAWRGGIIILAAILVIAGLMTPTIRGIFYMNLGTVQAHKAIAQLRKGAPAPREEMNLAVINLEKAVSDGRYTPHTYLLLGSMYGWLGDYPKSINAMRRYIALGGEQPPGSDFIAQEAQQLASEPPSAISGSAAGPSVSLLVGVAKDFAERLGLPRTKEVQLDRYRFITRRLVTRWQAAGSWWEPYLQAGIVLNEEMNDPSAAAKTLDEGIRTASFKAPLQYYRQFVKG